MRKRINRVCVASSSNYTQSKKAHKQMLEENHIENNHIFIMIQSQPVRQKTELELFEEGLKRQLQLFKERRVS